MPAAGVGNIIVGLEQHRHVAEPDGGARRERRLADDRLSLDEGAVGAAEIADDPEPSRRCSLAWVVLTLGSASTISLKSARPIFTTGTRMGMRRPRSEPVRTRIEAIGSTPAPPGPAWASRSP